MVSNIVENDVIRAELQDGISQVDENLTIDEFESSFDKSTRKLKVHITVRESESGETMELSEIWG